MKAVVSYRLATFGRLQWLLFGCTSCLAVLAMLLGVFACLLLVFLLSLSYFAMLFVCYHPEAQHWRDKIDQSYERLFQYLFRTGSGTNSPIKSGPPKQSVGFRDSGSTFATAELKAAKQCHKEAQKIVQLLMRDFVVSWYSDVTGDVEFPEDVQKILEHVALEVNIRLQKIDLDEIVPEILSLVLPYLEAVNEAGDVDYNGVNVFDTSNEKCLRTFEGNPRVSHRALRSPGGETRYYRQAVDVLLQSVLPTEYVSCDVACMFVREILVRNVVEPVLDLLCDPDFLNESIPIVLAKAPLERVRKELDDIHHENEELEKQISRGRLLLKHKRAMTQRRRFCSLSGRFNQSAFSASPHSLSIHPAATPFGSYTEIDVPSDLAKNGRSGIPTTTAATATATPVADLRAGSTVRIPNFKRNESDSQLLSESPHMASPPHWSPSLRTKRRPAEKTRAASLADLDVTASLPLNFGLSPPQESYYKPKSGIPTSQMFATTDDSSSSPIEEGCEPESEIERAYRHDSDMVIVDLPPIFVQNHVRVEKGTSTHVGYIFKFPQRMLTTEDLLDLGVREGEGELEAMRRYSDFVTFHAALLKSPLSIYVKGLELPEKRGLANLIAKLPFVTPDPDPTIILERRQGLERYIQSVSSNPEVVRSDLFRQFLKNGVKILREAHVVSPPQRQPPSGGPGRGGGRRKTLLGMMKGHGNFLSNEEADVAKPLPKCPSEAVLSTYLNTHLPLPCRTLHTPHSVSATTIKLQSDSQLQPTDGRGPLQKKPHQILVTDSERGSTSTSATSSSRSSPTRLHMEAPVSESDNTGMPLATNSLPTYKLACSHTMEKSASSSSLQLEQNIERGTDMDSQSAAAAIDELAPDSAQVHPEATDSAAPTLSSSTALHVNNFQPETREDNAHKTTSEGSNAQPEPSRDSPSARVRERSPLLSAYLKCRQFLSKLSVVLMQLVSFILYIIREGFQPTRPQTSSELLQKLQRATPIANALLSLGKEASKRNCPQLWATNETTQIAILTLVGGGAERFLQKEIHELAYNEQNWCRALYHLRHTLWPRGIFDRSPRKQKSAEKKAELKRQAAEAFKQFLPDFFPHIVGAEDYNRAVKHCIECLQNPRINRHFLLGVIDLLLKKLVPEIDHKNFQKHLAKMRTAASLCRKPANL